jgi:hypothetical protein
MTTSITYLLYITISVLITVFVASTLSKNGKHFLVDGFDGNEPLAASVNHLLVVGFYLINTGFVLVRMRIGVTISSLENVITYLASNVGSVLIILGAAHFINMLLISSYRASALKSKERKAALAERAANARPLPRT